MTRSILKTPSKRNMFEKREHNCRDFVRLEQLDEGEEVDKHIRSLLKRTSSRDGGCMLVSDLGSCANL